MSRDDNDWPNYAAWSRTRKLVTVSAVFVCWFALVVIFARGSSSF